MAFPAVEGSNSSTEAAATTSHTVSLPASIASGELLIAVFAAVNDDTPGGGSVLNPGWPAGWTEFGINDTARQVGSIAYRFADGNEGSTITVTTDDNAFSAHTTYRISGAEDPASQAPEQANVVYTSSSAPDPPSLTASWGSDDNLWIVALSHSNDHTVSATPSGYGNLVEVNTGGATRGNMSAMATQGIAAATEDPGTWSLSGSDRGIAFTAAVKPAASGTTISETLTEGVSATDTHSQAIPQMLRPDGDLSVGSWTDEGGATSNLFQSIDEVDPDDADYVEGP